MDYRNFEKKGLAVLRVIMYIPMLIVYAVAYGNTGNDDFSWATYFDKLEEAINRYWSS